MNAKVRQWPLIFVIVVAIAAAIGIWLFFETRESRHGEEEDSAESSRRAFEALLVAHVADPRIGTDARDPSANGAVLVSALRALRAQPGIATPAVVVMSGELTASASPGAEQRAAPAGPKPDTTKPPVAPTDTGKPRSTVGNAYATLGHELQQSPASQVFLWKGSPIPVESLTIARLAAESASVHVFDLAACSSGTSASATVCDVGTSHRLIALPDLSATVSTARALIDSADSLVSRANRQGRRAILVPWNVPATDSASKKTADAFLNLTSRKGVAAVLIRSGLGLATPSSKFVLTSSIGALASGTPPSARGFTVATLGSDNPLTESLSYDRGFQRVPTSERSPPRLSWLARFWTLAESLGEPGRSAIFSIAMLVAFLTIATLWKVPATVREDVAAPLSPNAPASVAAGQTVALAQAQPTSGNDDVFKSNLGKTVLSGLTGIAAVTILKDVWGVSGTGGQAWFAIVFIAGFFVLLLFSALLRAATEALRERVVAVRLDKSLGDSARRRFLRWSMSFRTTGVVFLDTLSSVLFGRAPDQLMVWTPRYTALQEAILSAIDRMREQVSNAVGDALREAGFPDASAERDYRVNVSLLAESRKEAFYVSTERGSLPSIFGEKSVARVAILFGAARWWKISYEGKHVHVRSAEQLVRADGTVADANTELKRVQVRCAGSTKPVPNNQIDLVGVRGDSTAVTSAPTNAPTVGDLLAHLNSQSCFGGGGRPAVASIDREGHIIIADSATGSSSLAVTSLTLGGVVLTSLAVASVENVVLFENDTPVVIPDAGPLLMLHDYFEKRGSLDYQAFIVIPVPFAQRGLVSGQRQAGIHISFSRAAYLNAIWSALETVDILPPLAGAAPGTMLKPSYADARQLLQSTMMPNSVLRGVLSEAVRILGELIQPLSDTWYWSRGRR